MRILESRGSSRYVLFVDPRVGMLNIFRNAHVRPLSCKILICVVIELVSVNSRSRIFMIQMHSLKNVSFKWQIYMRKEKSLPEVESPGSRFKAAGRQFVTQLSSCLHPFNRLVSWRRTGEREKKKTTGAIGVRIAVIRPARRKSNKPPSRLAIACASSLIPVYLLECHGHGTLLRVWWRGWKKGSMSHFLVALWHFHVYDNWHVKFHILGSLEKDMVPCLFFFFQNAPLNFSRSIGHISSWTMDTNMKRFLAIYGEILVSINW